MSERRTRFAPGAVFRMACALAAFLVPLLLYLDTLAPTVLDYDSGMLQTKAYTLGIGHPTGYPTFILLGKLFTYLPVGDPAYRVNLSSAVYAASASLFIYLAANRLLLSSERSAPNLAAASSGIAALSFAASSTFWSQAIIAEVYTLNVCLLAATLYALLAWRDSGRDRLLYLTAFLAGLAMTAHMTSGLFIPAALVFVLLAKRETLKRRTVLGKAVLAFLAGLSPYLYLPLRGSMHPVMTYGNPSTVGGFFNLISGGSYKDQMLAFGPTELPGRVVMYLDLLAGQYPLLLFIPAALGAVAIFRADRAAFALLGVLGLGSLSYALEYDIHDIAVYFLPSYLVISLFIAAGLYLVATVALVKRVSPSYARYAALPVLGLALLVLALKVPGTLNAVDQSQNLATRRLVESIVRETTPDAAVLGGSSLSALYYAQLVEDRRTDLHPASAFRAKTIVRNIQTRQEEGDTYVIQLEPAENSLEPPPPDYEQGLKKAGYHMEPVAENLYRISA